VKTIDVDDELMDDIRELVASKAGSLLLNIIANIHAADVAEIIDRLKPGEAKYVFGLLDPQNGSEVLLELDPAVRERMFESMSSDQIGSYVGLLPSDDAADLVAELPPYVAERVLRAMPAEDSSDVKTLMRYREDSAGGIMGTEMVAVKTKDTVQKAIRVVRDFARTMAQVYSVYVVDDAGVLAGVVPLQSLVLNSPNRQMGTVMETDVKSVHTEMDQEEVAQFFRKYDLISVPVVDAGGHLVGHITIDDVVDVLVEEHSEDVARMVGSDAEELERRSPTQIALLRLPWVLITLGVEFLGGIVIHLFDKTLSQVILLASFMPIISAISGNTGLQSAAIVVRAIATGHVDLERWWPPIWRQMQTTLIIGAVCGMFIGVVGTFWHGKWEFGLVVGVSMMISINISGVVGTLSPLLSKKFGFDPALTAGPFETAFQDVVGITIFLTLATSLLHWLV
jgi:magnesium transporter